jgi:3-oxoacyl-[acyl-carrier-protein] synthase-3
MYKAGEPNPVGLLGAMWIIEGLGEKMASSWADRIEELTGHGRECTRFARYHAANDDSHMDRLYGLIDRICTSQQAADEVVRTAKIVARLYAMQLEAIDRDP